MTASQPLPDDAASEPEIVAPPLPAQSAADAAASAPTPAEQPETEPAPPVPRPPRKRPARPSAPRSPRPSRAKKPAVTPPPPAVPAAVAAAQWEAETTSSTVPSASEEEIEVPPRPPLPVVAPEAEVEPETQAEVEAEPEVEAQPEPEAELEPEVEVEVEVEPEPEAELEPEVEVEPEPEPVVEPEPEAELEPEAAQESDPEPAGAEAAPVVDIAIDAAVPALLLHGVMKSFGQTRAVDAIDLRVPAGTFYGIVGPNGAGKTTTLSMIAGLLRADHGTIEIAGVDLGADPRRAKQQMGILPDRLRTFDRLTGRQLLHYYGVLRGLRGAVVESRTADLARAFDLTDALGRKVSDFSTGMTKKIMLAGAMIHSPRVLVLDEPFESVDPVSSAVILDILGAYVAHGGTVILSSHGMDLVERVCSGVAVIVAGQVLAQGTIDEVRGELTLEERFIELAGGDGDVEGLEWLHTFSD